MHESNERLRQRDAIRQQLRTQRDALGSRQQSDAAIAVVDLCLPLLSTHQHIGTYFAIGGELPVDNMVTALLQQGKTCYAPIISEGNKLLFAEYNSKTPMRLNKFRIREPDINPEHYRKPRDLDAVLVPLVGFDENRNRMGMGGGYYDRSFAHRRETAGKPVLIGIAHDIQQVDDVLSDWWDVPLDYVLTPERILR